MIKLFDTFRSDFAELVAPKDGIFKFYTCGITPYDSSHIGHARVYLTYDILQRRLRSLGYQTNCVRNVTDVDDDILRKARELNVNYLDLAKSEMVRFTKSMERLNLITPYSSPRASSAISEILNIIGQLIERGHAYVTANGVYFDVKSAQSFGSLSKYDEKTMLYLASERGGNPEDPNKRNPLDFILWQPSKDDEPSWDSRWGPGRPGWHIECAALVLREHGQVAIDLHGGGADLIFPHHECEKTVAEIILNAPFVGIWMHTAMVYYKGEKMSKSLGNLVFVDDVFQNYEPAALRIGLLTKHYRDPFEFDYSLLKEGQELLDLFRSTPSGEGSVEKVAQALDDDLNTPFAIEILAETARAKKPVGEGLELLGIRL